MVPPDLDHATRAWAGEVLDALRAGGHDPGDPVQAADALALLAELDPE